MAWHGDPSLLRRDAYSGDYGIGLYGYWRSAAAYLNCSAWRGWECMLCDIVGSPQADGAEKPGGVSDVCGGRVTISPRDALRRRAYIARLGLTISVEGAVIEHLTFEGSTHTVKLALLRHEAAPSSEAALLSPVRAGVPASRQCRPYARFLSWDFHRNRMCPPRAAGQSRGAAEPWRVDKREHCAPLLIS